MKKIIVSLLVFLSFFFGILSSSSSAFAANVSQENCSTASGFFPKIGCTVTNGVNAIGGFVSNIFSAKKENEISNFSRQVPLDEQKIEVVAQIAETLQQNILSLTERYTESASEEKKGIVSVLSEQSEKRKEAMKELAKRDPRAFLEQVIDEKIVSKMPAEVQKNFEKKTSLSGTVATFHYDDFTNKTSREEYFVKSKDGERLEFFPVGLENPLPSGVTIETSAVRIDTYVVASVATPGFRVMSASASEGILGPQKALFVLTNFDDSNTPIPFSPEEARKIVFEGRAQEFFKDQSYGKAWMTGDVIGWYTRKNACPGMNNCVDLNDGVFLKFLDEKKINLKDYGYLVFLSTDYIGGWSSVGKYNSFIGGKEYKIARSFVGVSKYSEPSYWGAQSFQWTNLDYVLAHELGHAFGLLHANSWECGAGEALYGKCEHFEYGNYYDTMGSTGFSLSFNAFYKEVLGWISKDDGSELLIDKSGTYELNAMENGTGARGAKIKILNSDEPFSIEYRRGLGFDSKLNNSQFASNQKGIFINKIKKDSWVSMTRLLDMTPVDDRYEDWEAVTLNIGGGVFKDEGLGITIGPVRSADEEKVVFDVKVEEPRCVIHPPIFELYGIFTKSRPKGYFSVSGDITNEDSEKCGNSVFKFSAETPSGWKSDFFAPDGVSSDYASTTEITLSPGEKRYFYVSLSVSENAEEKQYSTKIKIFRPQKDEVEKEFITDIYRYPRVVLGIPTTINVSPGQTGVLLSDFSILNESGKYQSFIKYFYIQVAEDGPININSLKVYNGAQAFPSEITKESENNFRIYLKNALEISPKLSADIQIRGDIKSDSKIGSGSVDVYQISDQDFLYIENPFVRGNTVVVTKELDTPKNLSARFTPDPPIVNLMWDDTSSGEDGFEIWRSANDESGYELIAEVPANTVSFEDTKIFSSSTKRFPDSSKSTRSPNFFQRAISFISNIFSKSPEKLAGETSVLPSGIELDLPSYLPKELLKPQKLFSGRTIRIPKDKFEEMEVLSANQTEGLTLKSKRIRGNYVSFEINKDLTQEVDLKIKLKDNAGKIEEKTLKVFGTPPEAGIHDFKRSDNGQVLSRVDTEKSQDPKEPGEFINVSRKNLNCGSCFWEMVMAGQPNNSNNLLIQGWDKILRTVDGWLSWTDEYINDVTVKNSDYARRGPADGYLAVDNNGNFVLPGIVSVPRPSNSTSSISDTIFGGGVHFGNIRGGSLTEKIIEDATNPAPGEYWIVFDFPKIATYKETIFVPANAVQFEDGIQQGIYISKDGGKTFIKHKRPGSPLDIIFNIDSDTNGVFYGVSLGDHRDKVKLLRFFDADLAKADEKIITFEGVKNIYESDWGASRVSTVSNRGWSSLIIPVIKVDKTSSPFHGRIYVALAVPEKILSDPSFEYPYYYYNIDIFLKYSDDQGNTWSEPVKVNDDVVKNPVQPGPARYFYKVRAFQKGRNCEVKVTKKMGFFCDDDKVYSDFSSPVEVKIPRPANSGETPGDQVFPSMSIDEDGGVYLAWLDRRGIMDAPYFNVYYAYSKDGGRTFSKNIKVNNEPIPNFLGGRDPGDYLDMIAAYKNKTYIAYPCNSPQFLSGGFSTAEWPTDLCVATIVKEKSGRFERQ